MAADKETLNLNEIGPAPRPCEKFKKLKEVIYYEGLTKIVKCMFPRILLASDVHHLSAGFCAECRWNEDAHTDYRLLMRTDTN